MRFPTRSAVGVCAAGRRHRCRSAACGGGGQQGRGTRRPPAKAKARRPKALPVAPLTGLPDADRRVASKRCAITVKIDNTQAGHPKYGVDQADVVYEEVVEGGITRLAAIFNSHDPDRVGPVRSVRKTDQSLVWPIGGVFAYSGGAPYAIASINTAPVVRLDETRAGSADVPRPLARRAVEPLRARQLHVQQVRTAGTAARRCSRIALRARAVVGGVPAYVGARRLPRRLRGHLELGRGERHVEALDLREPRGRRVGRAVRAEERRRDVRLVRRRRSEPRQRGRRGRDHRDTAPRSCSPRARRSSARGRGPTRTSPRSCSTRAGQRRSR